MKIFLSIFLLITVLVPCHAQKVKPALNLIKGNTYYSISDLNTAITQTMNGQAITYTIGMSTKTSYKVLDAKDTVYILEVNYKNVGMKMQAPGGSNMEYNSSNKDATDIASQVLYAMVDKPFTVTLSKNGRVIAVHDVEKMMDDVFKNIKTDSTQLQQFRKQFMQSFGEKAFKSNLDETFAIYPGVKVAKNDKWTVNTQLQSVMETNVNATYQLMDITPDSYIIHGEARLTTANNGSVAQMGGMPIKYNLAGTTVSDIKADKVTGWITESKQKEEISGNISIQDNPKMPGGMQMPMSVHADVITTDQ